MTYVFRDPARIPRRPVHEPDTAPAVLPAPPAEADAPRPEPVTNIWGGPLGLKLATTERLDFEHRAEARTRLIAAADEIREHNRVHGWKPKPPRRTAP